MAYVHKPSEECSYDKELDALPVTTEHKLQEEISKATADRLKDGHAATIGSSAVSNTASDVFNLNTSHMAKSRGNVIINGDTTMNVGMDLGNVVANMTAAVQEVAPERWVVK